MWLLLSSVYIFLAIMMHSFACYSIKSGTAFAKFIIVGISVGTVLILNLFSLYGFDIKLIAGTLTYAFACELYIFLFTFIASSISVSIILNLVKKPHTIKQLKEIYSGKIMVDNRLRRLSEIGLLQQDQSNFCLTKKGLLLLRRFNSLRLAFGFI